MKVFISWSGERSKAVAELMRDWIQCVLQSIRPWISTRDLDRGSIWFNEINDQLKDTSIGIICLTQENKDRPWILFEAGALIKGLSSSRVCTFLVDLEPKDIRDPLAQFNHTFPTKESVRGLVETLNNHLGLQSLDYRILQTVFNTYWPQFDAKFKGILDEIEPTPEAAPRNDSDILAEILANTRNLSLRISRLESEKNKENRAKGRVLTESNLKSLMEELRHMRTRGIPDDEIRQVITDLDAPSSNREDLLDRFSRLVARDNQRRAAYEALEADFDLRENHK